ncbi:DUF1918 domain-containing protein [Kitasatospora brasiliensis]|uniref:DUF1918 domain-containing protein n=1 Tax=Kitasatospora brasiliensis TaxID=3058040 RepID=UPI00292EAC76|nr:DUF1918 domain-containing protein [Kitasatospora sp. K002]
MKAAVGDRITVEGTRPGAARREGEIVRLHHPDGSPPYDVRWADDDRVTEYVPGPDARIHPATARTVPPHPHLFAD